MKDNNANFPEWEPLYRNEEKMNDTKRESYHQIRNSSRGFTAKKEVREYLFKKFNNKCKICGSDHYLVIARKISIYDAYKDKSLIKNLNSEENFIIVCKECSKKLRG